MTIPEFAQKIHCLKKQCILGDCYDTHIIFFSMVNPYITEDNDIDIFVDTTKASLGIVKYKLKTLSESYDMTYLKEVYNGMNIDQFNKTFTSSTKLLKNNVLQISICKKDCK